MRKFTTIAVLALVMGFGAAVAQAETGYLSAVHGIPGLAEDVEVHVNGDYLFSFGFGETFGPAALPAGEYKVEIFYQNIAVLSGAVEIADGDNFTVAAYLDESGSIAPLAVFSNEVSPIGDGPVISPTLGSARLQVFHLAAAPTVDASVRIGTRSVPQFEMAGLSNGEQATAIDVAAGRYNVGLLAGDVEVFNTGTFRLYGGDNLAVYAVGVFPDTFQLVYLALN